jgi:hypothetical protein
MSLEHVVQRRDQRRVELDRDHVGAARVERQGERAETRPDLDHPIAGADVRVADDRPRDVRIEQEVLAERPPGSDPVAVRELPEFAGAEAGGPTS